jgi:hypothetical protein
MVFGGNKKIIKILTSIIITFVVFSFSSFSNAEQSPLESQISELNTSINNCTRFIPGSVSAAGGTAVVIPDRFEFNPNEPNCTLSTQSEYDSAKNNLSNLERQKNIQEKSNELKNLNNLIKDKEQKNSVHNQALNDCYLSDGSFNAGNSNPTLCDQYSGYTKSQIDGFIANNESTINNSRSQLGNLNEDLQELEDAGLEKCGITNPQGCVNNLIKGAITAVSNTIISFNGLILRAAALFLNGVVHVTILDMSDLINGTEGSIGASEGIRNAWLIFRDLINILFIFGLLYASIYTIVVGALGDRTKKLLTNVILSALLINFSYFFTAVLIDVSNFLTIEIYNQLGECVENVGEDGIAGGPGFGGQGVANCFISGLKLTTTLDNSKPGLASEIMPPEGTSAVSSIQTDKKDIWAVARQSLIGVILGSIFIIVSSFVFIALAIMLIIRFVMLIILLITSPVMFLAWVLPGFSGITSTWFKALKENLIWVPAAFLFLLITLKIMEATDLGGNTLFSGIINYMMIMTFMVASLLVAKKAGAAGGAALSGRAVGLTKGLTAGLATRGLARGAGSLGRNTIGRGAQAWANRIDGSTRMGKFAKQNLQGVAGKSFDMRNTKAFQGVASATGVNAGTGASYGYQQRIDDKAKKKQEYADSIGKQTQDETNEINAITQRIQNGYTDENGVEVQGATDIKSSSGKKRNELVEEMEVDRSSLKDLNSQMSALKEAGNKDTEEYRAIKQQAVETSKRMQKSKDEIQEIDKKVLETFKDDFEAIEQIKEQGKERKKEYINSLRAQFAASSSDNQAANMIEEGMRNKDGKTGYVDETIKNYKKMSARITRDEENRAAREEINTQEQNDRINNAAMGDTSGGWSGDDE